MELDKNIISNAGNYFEKLGFGDGDIDIMEDDSSKKISSKEFEKITEIIALQVSYFCLRRLRYSCQSNSDTIHTMLCNSIAEYEKMFGKKFVNPNKDLID